MFGDLMDQMLDEGVHATLAKVIPLIVAETVSYHATEKILKAISKEFDGYNVTSDFVFTQVEKTGFFHREGLLKLAKNLNVSAEKLAPYLPVRKMGRGSDEC